MSDLQYGAHYRREIPVFLGSRAGVTGEQDVLGTAGGCEHQRSLVVDLLGAGSQFLVGRREAMPSATGDRSLERRGSEHDRVLLSSQLEQADHGLGLGQSRTLP